MSVDESIYMNAEELNINTTYGQDTDGETKRAEDVVRAEKRRFKMAIVFLGLLGSTFLITAIGVGARYSTVCAQMMGRLLNFTLETEALQIRVQNLTGERDQINMSYYLNMKELEKAKEKMVCCPKGWSRFGCSCYHLSTTTNTWEGSRQQCQNKGADLVIINDQREMMFLNKLGASFWIGLRADTYSDWRWRDGSSIISWFSQKYKPSIQRHRDWSARCAVLQEYSSESSIQSWDGQYCHNYHQWVCEKDVSEEWFPK